MRWNRVSFGLVLAAALVGCSDSTGPMGEHTLQVNVTVVNGGAAASAVAAPQAPAATTVEVESATFVLGGLKLETAGLDDTIDWIFQQSVVVPLDLTGTPVLVFDTDVTPGTYKELELSVDKLEVGNPAEDPLIEDYPLLADASVLVTGTVTRDDGAPESYSFTAALDIDLELLFAEPIEYTEEDNPVTLVSLTIDVGSWFVGNGDMLDPTDPANRSDIEGNIEASLELDDED